MINKIKAIVNKNHKFICDVNTIGRAGENQCTELEIELYEHLCNSWIYLDFISPNGSKYKTPKLDIVGNTVNYAIPNSVLCDKGIVTIQMIAQNEEGIIWETDVKEFYVRESINAVDEIENKEDFITDAQRLLNEIEEGLTPTIGDNENWFVLDKDTGKPSRGEKGRGIHYMEIEDNHLIVGYTDGTSENLGEIPGEREFKVDPEFANNTWETIAEVSRYGDPSRYWRVGQYKMIKIGNKNYPVQIIGFNHDTVTDKTKYGKGKAGITLMLGCCRGAYNNQIGVYDGNISKLSISTSDNHIISPNKVLSDGSRTEVGTNWQNGGFRTYLQQHLDSVLPSELRENIVSVNKIFSNTFSAKNYYREMGTISDKYFLMSEYELYGEQIVTKANEGDQYELFKNGASKVIMTPELYKKFTDGTTGIVYSRLWLRSVVSRYTDPYIPSTDYFAPTEGYTDNPDYTDGINARTNSLLMSYNGTTETFNYLSGGASGTSIPAYITPCFCL